MDLDTYESSKFVLEKIKPYLEKNCTLIFDELYNYPGWDVGEYKALKEWTEAFYPEYEVLGEVNNYYQLAIKVTRMN